MHQRPDVVTVGSLFVEITPTQPGETLQSAQQYTLVAGGGAANTVFALARLGMRVRFITAVGDDEFGALVIDTLRAFGVDTGGVRRVPTQLTPVSFCAIDGKGGKQFRFYRFPGFASPMQALTAEDFHPGAAGHGRLFDFCEGSIREPALRPLVFQAARDARRAGVPVLYAVNLRRGAWPLPEEAVIAIEREALALADIAVLNNEELAFVTQGRGVRDVQACGPRVVVVTRGGDGEMSVHVGDQQAAVPPFRVPVVYDVGAGDTFHAALVAAALQGDPATLSLTDWADALRFAAATAAIRVSTSADPRDLPTTEQVRRWMGNRLGIADC